MGERRHRPVERRNDIGRQQPQGDAERREQAERNPRANGCVGSLGRTLRARHAEKPHCEDLGETGRSETGGQRQQGAGKRKHNLDPGRGEQGRPQNRLQGQPFADKAVKWRQRRDRQHADQKEGARPWHAAEDAAEPVEIARPGASLDRAGADKQQRLVHRVIGEVIERRDQRDGRDGVVAGRDKGHCGADPGRDDPHIFDRAVGEQPLHLRLDRRIKDADQRREAADHQHNKPRGGCLSPAAGRD